MSWRLLFVPLLLATGFLPARGTPQVEGFAADPAAPVRTAGADDVAPDTGEVPESIRDHTPTAETDEVVPEAEKAAEGIQALVQTAELDREMPEAREIADGTPGPAQTEDVPKLIDGMSILGNQEAPKSLVIVPWKSSEIGDSLGISTMLDDSRQPVDRDVFLRELSYYEIRCGASP
jgi:hypothetical protein